MSNHVTISPVTDLNLQFNVSMEDNNLPVLEPEIDIRVGEIWDLAVKKRDRGVYNSKVVTVATSDCPLESAITRAEFTEYRRVLAQLEDPSLFTNLEIYPLAVTGFINCADGILIGKRGEVSQDSGCWEVLPSGGIEESCVRENGVVDLSCQLRCEFNEEVGENLPELEDITPIFWIVEEQTHVVDIVLRATIPCTLGEILDSAGKNENNEYLNIDAVSNSSIPDELNNASRTFNNTTVQILTALMER